MSIVADRPVWHRPQEDKCDTCGQPLKIRKHKEKSPSGRGASVVIFPVFGGGSGHYTVYLISCEDTCHKSTRYVQEELDAFSPANVTWNCTLCSGYVGLNPTRGSPPEYYANKTHRPNDCDNRF